MTDENTPLTDEKIRELKALEKEMSPAPWNSCAFQQDETNQTKSGIVGFRQNEAVIIVEESEMNDENTLQNSVDIDGIADIRNAFPRLLGTIDQKDVEIEGQRERIEILSSRNLSTKLNEALAQMAVLVEEIEKSHNTCFTYPSGNQTCLELYPGETRYGDSGDLDFWCFTCRFKDVLSALPAVAKDVTANKAGWDRMRAFVGAYSNAKCNRKPPGEECAPEHRWDSACDPCHAKQIIREINQAALGESGEGKESG